MTKNKPPTPQDELRDDFNYTFNVDPEENQFYDEFTPNEMWYWIEIVIKKIRKEERERVYEKLRAVLVGKGFVGFEDLKSDE